MHQQIGIEPIPVGVDNAELVRRAIAASVAMRERIVAVIDYRRREANDAQDQASAGYRRMLVVMSLLVFASMAAGILLAWLIARRLSRQLGGEPDYAVDIAQKDPTEAKKIYEDVKARTPTNSLVYPRVKELEKTYE